MFRGSGSEEIALTQSFGIAMALAHINIGSNIGDRRAHIERAVAEIESALSVRALRSDYIESEPWGYDSPNPYLNLGIAVDSGSMTPLELHRLLQQIQQGIDPAPHRRADGTYADRTIDIDLITVGQAVIDTPELTLPHPRMTRRSFVLQPIARIDPAWRHPLTGLTAAGHLALLSESEQGLLSEK